MRSAPPDWQSLVRIEVERLQAELDRLGRQAGTTDYGVAYERVERARELLSQRHRGWDRWHSWWTGAPIELSWAALHGADQALLMIQDPATVSGRLTDRGLRAGEAAPR